MKLETIIRRYIRRISFSPSYGEMGDRYEYVLFDKVNKNLSIDVEQIYADKVAKTHYHLIDFKNKDVVKSIDEISDKIEDITKQFIGESANKDTFGRINAVINALFDNQ